MMKKIFAAALLITASAFAGNVQVLDEKNFDNEISKGTVLVDFYAEWCGPCKRLGPVLEMVADDMQGQVAIYKVNYDHSRDLAKSYDVSSLPTLILFKNGKEVRRAMGYRDKSALKQFIAGDK